MGTGIGERAATAVHERWIATRRVRVLTAHFARVLPRGAQLLDVGTGDGRIARSLSCARPDLEIACVDVMAREDAHVEVAEFDGETLPYDDGSFDGVLFADVLHHSAEPRVLLREARRVARSFVVIKDHLKDGFLAGPTLRFMDRVGNERHGVALPYNYWRRAEWDAAFAEVGLAPVEWIADLRLYPRPADWIFGRGLHFITRLECAPGAAHSPRGSAGCRGSR